MHDTNIDLCSVPQSSQTLKQGQVRFLSENCINLSQFKDFTTHLNPLGFRAKYSKHS